MPCKVSLSASPRVNSLIVSTGERERALLPFTQRVQEWQSTYWCAAALNRPDRPNPVVLTKNRSTISYLMNMNLL
jgi:hypothetical protein